MGDVGLAIERAEDKTAQMQARAGAIDELIASGALDDASWLGRGDDIARELAAMSSQPDVEAELAALKARAPSGEAHGAGDRRRHHQPRSEDRAAAEAEGQEGSRDRPDPGGGPVGRRGGTLEALNALDAAVESAVEADDGAFTPSSTRCSTPSAPRAPGWRTTPSRTPT